MESLLVEAERGLGASLFSIDEGALSEFVSLSHITKSVIDLERSANSSYSPFLFSSSNPL